MMSSPPQDSTCTSSENAIALKAQATLELYCKEFGLEFWDDAPFKASGFHLMEGSLPLEKNCVILTRRHGTEEVRVQFDKYIHEPIVTFTKENGDSLVVTCHIRYNPGEKKIEDLTIEELYVVPKGRNKHQSFKADDNDIKNLKLHDALLQYIEKRGINETFIQDWWYFKKMKESPRKKNLIELLKDLQSYVES